MCGLSGVAAIGGDLPPVSDGVVRDMCRAVGHRGPDGVRMYADGPVALGFRRLALVGPTGGDQPLFSEGDEVVLIANGEVYNHRELAARFLPDVRMRTTSDCEVLAHLYARRGARFLDDVVGMHAIALWDRRANRLVLARDRFGIKPLYYTRVGGAVLFASEIKALFAHPGCPRELDWAAALADQSMNVSPYLTTEPVNTWFRGIEIVPAGTIVTIDLADGSTASTTYWSLPDFDGDLDIPDGEFIEAYRDRLVDAVRDCVHADTEIGLFLSGGVDSTAVAAIAAGHGSPVHTFSVLSESTLANGDAEFAHRAAAAFGMPNHQLLFGNGAVPRPQEWKQLLWLLETPLCGPEQYYKYELYRYAKHARPELRGMLLGAGSDEYNGGFSTVFGLDDNWAGFEDGVLRLARATVLHGYPALRPWWEHRESPLLSDELIRDRAGAILNDPYSAYVAWRHRHMLQYNCWHEDRTAAGNGVEARVPFLDHRVVELLARIPVKRRPDLLWDKRILRDAVRGLLPAEIADRPKVPFYYGQGAEFTHRMVVRMLAKDGGALVEEALSSPGTQQFLDPDGLRAMHGRLLGEPEPWDVEYLLRLVNLGLLDQMATDLPPVPLDFPQRAVLTAAPIEDWDRDSPAVAAQIRSGALPEPDDVIEFGDGVLLVRAREHPDCLYVAINGEFAYVAKADADPAWFAFLDAVDGRRTLAEVLAAAGQDHESVKDTLSATISAGILHGVKR